MSTNEITMPRMVISFVLKSCRTRTVIGKATPQIAASTAK